jgi:tRNA-specific 2-thiouridylase
MLAGLPYPRYGNSTGKQFHPTYMKPLIAIALSGGIDSLTSGYLLKQQGYSLLGLHFITGFEDEYQQTGKEGISAKTNPEETDAELITRFKTKLAPIADQLDIPIEIVDVRQSFKSNVIDYFCRTYQMGQTPNPCIVCNPNIKFGLLLEYALQKGATGIATGHYARINQSSDGYYHLLKGIDPLKEQSYFLSRLNQEQLSHAHFPLAEMIKPAVKALARENGLKTITQAESQDICFIKESNYAAFLSRITDIKLQPGPIVDLNGNQLGMHNGLHLFTIGQRRGINVPAAEPYYVVRIDMAQNHLVVGSKKDLYSKQCNVIEINWINQSPQQPIKVQVRIRYRNKEVPAIVTPLPDQAAWVKFNEPQMAVTPGQAAVFYQDDEVLGGGWITT